MASEEPAHADVVAAPESWRRGPSSPLWRRVLPFVFAAALLAFVLSRIERDAFVATLAKLNVPGFVGFAALYVVGLLTFDALGSRVVYRLVAPSIRLGDLFVYRAAAYLPGILNHHLGQGFLTYVMSRLAGVPIARMAGSTLVSYAGWLGCLLGCVCFAIPFSTLPLWYVPVIVASGLLYLGVIALRPLRIAGVSFLAPLFEAGVRGHAVALLARVPHLLCLVLGNWGAFFFFDVHVPAGTALVYLPIILVATTLPITPQGFGTRDALSGIFFGAFAVGATTSEERLAQVAACTASWGVVTTLLGLVAGVLSMRVVNRRLELLAAGRWTA